MPVIDQLIARITALPTDRIARVAVDGPDAAGKSTLAATITERLDRPVQHISVDSFHQPRDVRVRRGELSPEGYYRDSFDYDALREVLDRIDGNHLLLVDGVFLLRPELRHYWDFSIYLHISPAETLRRALVRDAGLFGDAVRERYTHRYLPGQARYRAEADPMRHANIVIDNTDPTRPEVMGRETP